MQTPRTLRILLGAGVWVVLAGVTAVVVHRANNRAGVPPYPVGKVLKYLTSRPLRVRIDFPPDTPAFLGDPVCLRRRDELLTVGQIRSVSRQEGLTSVTVEFFDPAGPALTRETRFLAVPNPRTPAWVIDVLLPPERKEELFRDLRAFALEHREEISEAFWKPFEGFLRDAYRILEEDLPGVLERRDEEIQRIVRRHNQGTFEPRLKPLLEEEVWPALEKRSEPLMDRVGEKLLKEVPMMEIGWGQVKDWAPFLGEDNVRAVINDYIKQKAIPILKEHTDDFVRLAREVVSDVTKNPRCTAALKECLKALVDDPEFVGLMRDVFSDLVAPEGRIFKALRERFSAPDFLDRLNRLMEALGPTLNRAANRILLDREGAAINPDLARVLRTQILWKDACWILVEPAGGAPVSTEETFRGEVYSWKLMKR